MANNNKDNVSVGKPKVGGAVYRAPKGTTLPTDATTALANTYVNCGYISDAGIRHATNRSVENIKAWGGDVVLAAQTEYSDQYTIGFLEVLNPEVQKIVRGNSNVTGTVSGQTGMVSTLNSQELDESVFVIEEILTGNVAKRTIIPCGKPIAVAETTDADNNAIVYDITIAALPDSSGNTAYERTKGSSST